ncbi:MAG TPA: bifunctional folylpolyglutamate synthase/dihydrofolate synthase [Candidatus Merdenecus merdavium]|nr:bifunctional folylpolyglutamate synthase/dihydrofolate synthase [Candidatus Merdenecus merdavium]
MNIIEALQYIHSEQFRGSCLGLERITELMDSLGNPQRSLRFIHVAGTNGKGSVCAMLSEILIKAGYKTGLYTSPYIYNFNEQIRVNGVNISDQELIELVEIVKPYVDVMKEKPTEFELVTAIAFLHYQKVGCEIVVLEVGLGGRLDSTNVISAPEVAIITNIGLEHTELLGNTLEEIAREKGGIIKPGTTAILGSDISSVQKTVQSICNDQGVMLRCIDRNQFEQISGNLEGQLLNYKGWKEIKLGLLGSYQCENVMIVLEVVEVLRKKKMVISEKAVYSALETVKWPGRFEVLTHAPLCIVDGAHNPDGVKILMRDLRNHFPNRKITFIIGVMQDKDYEKMLCMAAPLAEKFITVTPPIERALPSAELNIELKKYFHGEVIEADRLEQALCQVLGESDNKSIICVFGTLYMIGAVQKVVDEMSGRREV